jgi:hypothetical protein
MVKEADMFFIEIFVVNMVSSIGTALDNKPF